MGGQASDTKRVRLQSAICKASTSNSNVENTNNKVSCDPYAPTSPAMILQSIKKKLKDIKTPVQQIRKMTFIDENAEFNEFLTAGNRNASIMESQQRLAQMQSWR